MALIRLSKPFHSRRHVPLDSCVDVPRGGRWTGSVGNPFPVGSRSGRRETGTVTGP